MGRTVYAEENLQNYLNSLGVSDAYTIGLIIGQSTALKDYVVHLARTSPISGSEVTEEANGQATNKLKELNSHILSVADVDVDLVADHAKHVTRMLPGGMLVLGIFIVGPENCLDDPQSVEKLKSVLVTIRRKLLTNVYLYGISTEENLILSYNKTTKQHMCKSIDTATSGFLKSAEWKFQKKMTKWYQIETYVELDYLLPIIEDRRPQTLKRQLQNILLKISEIVHGAQVILEGDTRSLDDTIDEVGKQRNEKSKEDSEENDKEEMLHANIYLPYVLKNESPEIKSVTCSASMRLVGELFSRTCLHQKATIGEVTSAIKEDILRSLATRLELHWDSLIEEENGSPEENITLHEPPRRVLVELPGSKLVFSDYLFPGEGPEESLVLFKELLDLDVKEVQVQKDVEFQVDPVEFYSQNDLKQATVEVNKEPGANNQLAIYIAIFLISLIIAIIAILAYQLNNTDF